ncbi:MAG: M16 family metallopeptidase [Gammaproteobacteria bacterium]
MRCRGRHLRAIAPVLLALALFPAFAARSAAAPRIEHWRTDGGAGVYFIAARELPIVDVRLLFDAGSARDEGAPGLAALTAALLTQGSHAADAQALADRLDGLGARLVARADRDFTQVSLRSLSAPDRLDPAIDLLADVIARPSLEAQAVARERARAEVRIRARMQSLPARLRDAAFGAAFAGHPYAHPVDGEPDAVSVLDAAAVRRFHARHYGVRSVVVAIVGDLDLHAARRLASRVVRALPDAPPPALLAPPASGEAAARVRIAAASTQVHVALVQRGVRLHDPDYFPLLVANHAFGGATFVSRLFQEIRDRRGLSYGVASALVPLRTGGLFLIELATRADQAEAAVTGVEAELRRFLQEGPTQAEIDAARRNLAGGFPLRIDSNAKKLDLLAQIAWHGLPLDYLETWPGQVARVTREQAFDAFRRRVQPGAMTTIVLGGDPPRP